MIRTNSWTMPTYDKNKQLDYAHLWSEQTDGLCPPMIRTNSWTMPTYDQNKQLDYAHLWSEQTFGLCPPMIRTSIWTMPTSDQNKHFDYAYHVMSHVMGGGWQIHLQTLFVNHLFFQHYLQLCCANLPGTGWDIGGCSHSHSGVIALVRCSQKCGAY